MRIISCNVNGIRSAARKGFFDWLAWQQADLVCLQEIRAHADQRADLPPSTGWHCHYHDAARKGYSGVAIYSRRPPEAVSAGLGWPDVDAEGRSLELRFGPLSVVSLYLPSGSASAERQAVKFAVLDRLLPRLQAMRDDGRSYILCGDWNIAHRPIDLKNWRANQKHSGFLPEERAWLDQVFGPVGWVDAFRRLHPHAEAYTWWSNRGRAWANNVGWRIDYQVITPDLADRVCAAAIYKEQRFSDHAPLILDYDYAL
jgi:exodeoxyribonuclease-3